MKAASSQSLVPWKSRFGGRKAQVSYVQNAHTDGDSIVYFADANVAVGDIMNDNHRYQQVDYANGGGT